MGIFRPPLRDVGEGLGTLGFGSYRMVVKTGNRFSVDRFIRKEHFARRILMTTCYRKNVDTAGPTTLVGAGTSVRRIIICTPL